MTKLQEAIAARRAAQAVAEQKTPEPTLLEVDYSKYADLIPEADPVDETLEEANKTIDALVERLGIVGAYKEFIHKMQPRVGRKSESIMISCPFPWHEDKNPSAWMNSDKNTWFCGGCQRGGDIYDLAAIGLGFNIENYKNSQFVELRRAIASHFGYEVFSAPGEPDIIYEPEPQKVNGKTKEEAVPSSPGSADEEEKEEDTPLDIAIEKKIESEEVYTLDWRKIVPQNTFLSTYMNIATKDNNVEEFHFWNALLALGMAAGRNVYLIDNPCVYGNLYICLMGGSGTGKTKSRRYVDRMIARVLPYKEDVDYPDGAKEIPTPNSAEYLIKAFSKPVNGVSPLGSPIVVDYASVRGIIRFEELSSFKTIAGRNGSDLGSRMLEFYDCKDRVTTGSRMGGDTIAVNPFASAFTTTQPRSLSKILSRADEESGFLNRWLFVGGRRKPQTFLGGVEPDMSEADKELFKIHVWANDERAVAFTREAIWKGNKDLNSFIDADKDKYDPALGRIDLTIKKLCLLFAINEMTTEITLEMYERVMQMYQYIKAYAIFRVENLEQATQQSETELLVIEKIKEIYEKTQEWPTMREILRPLQRRLHGAGDLIKILDGLVKANELKSISIRPKVGRPTTRYAIDTEA